MLVVRMGHDLGVMGSVVVTKHTLPSANVGIGVMHTNRIPQLSADNFIEVEVRIVPENDPAPDESIVIIRCQACDRFLDFADLDVLSQAAFNGCKTVVNDHAGTGFLCIN